VTTPGQRAKISLLNLNLSPGGISRVELPEVVQLVVVIVLTSENVQLAVMERGGGRGAWKRALVGGLCHLADRGLKGLAA